MITFNSEESPDFCQPVNTGNTGKESGVILNVRLMPRSSKNEVVGPYNGAIKIKVKSPPVDGAANSALIAYLSKLLKRPKSFITILSGHKSKEKRLRVEGVSSQEVKSRLLKKVL